MRDIRLAASISHGWYRYDEQYRLRKELTPESSWGIINQELWLRETTTGLMTQASLPSASMHEGYAWLGDISLSIGLS